MVLLSHLNGIFPIFAWDDWMAKNLILGKLVQLDQFQFSGAQVKDPICYVQLGHLMLLKFSKINEKIRNFHLFESINVKSHIMCPQL